MNRAERRAQHERMKQKERRYHVKWQDEPGSFDHPSHVETPKTCSCYMCGNPRRHFHELTRQEKIADLRWSD